MAAPAKSVLQEAQQKGKLGLLYSRIFQAGVLYCAKAIRDSCVPRPQQACDAAAYFLCCLRYLAACLGRSTSTFNIPRLA